MGNVIQTYRICWQVDLVFKTWKSIFKMNSRSCLNTARWQTFTYVRLLWIVVMWDIFIYTRAVVIDRQNDRLQLLSMYKCMKLVALNTASIRLWNRQGFKEFFTGFKRLHQTWVKYAIAEHRKGKGRTKMINIIYHIPGVERHNPKANSKTKK